jgi:hypothetical protein
VPLAGVPGAQGVTVVREATEAVIAGTYMTVNFPKKKGTEKVSSVASGLSKSTWADRVIQRNIDKVLFRVVK